MNASSLVVVATAMLRSQQAGRLANYSEVNADLRSAAEGELERCFFLWKMMKSQQQVDKSFINTTDAEIEAAPLDPKIKEYLEAQISLTFYGNFIRRSVMIFEEAPGMQFSYVTTANAKDFDEVHNQALGLPNSWWSVAPDDMDGIKLVP